MGRILREAFRANYNDFGGSTCTTFTHRFGGFSSHDLTIHPGQEDALLLVPFISLILLNQGVCCSYQAQ